MNIKEPDWKLFSRHRLQETSEVELKEWYRLNVKPINKMLAEGAEVFSDSRVGDHSWFESVPQKVQENTALVINVQPIEKDSAEKICKDLAEMYNGVISNEKIKELKCRAESLQISSQAGESND